MADITASGFTDASQNIGTSAVTVLQANRGRQSLFIQNLHATQIVYVRISPDHATAVTPAVADQAGVIRLAAAGGSVDFSGNWVPSGAVSIIASGATTPVTVYEGR